MPTLVSTVRALENEKGIDPDTATASEAELLLAQDQV